MPLKDDIDAYFEREVRPHVPDAWMDRSKDKVGYEINFNRHFYKYTPPRSLEADRRGVEAGRGRDHAVAAGGDGVSTVSWGAEFPADWPRTRIEHICRFAGGGTPDKGNAAFWNGDIPWVSPKDMKSAWISRR